MPDEIQRAAIDARCHKNGPFEVRLNEDGSIDEILMSIDGKCVMHIEQMSDSTFFMGLYAEGKTMHSFFGAKNHRAHAKITAEWWEDEGTGPMDSFGFDN